MTLISQTKVQLFDPLLTNVDEILAYMRSRDCNCSHPHPDGKQIIFLIDGNVVIEENNLPSAHFISHGSMATMEENQFRFFSSHATSLMGPSGDITTYATNVLFPGTTGKVKIDGSYQIFSVSDKRTGTYFDLQAFMQSDTLDCLTYSKQKLGSLHHSGDVIKGIAILLHTININQSPVDECKFVVSVAGYGATPLVNFINQNPIIVIADHENCIVNIVPFSLDQATLGNSTMAGIVNCQTEYVDGVYYLKYHVLEQIVSCPNTTTGQCGSTVESIIKPVLLSPVVVNDIPTSVGHVGKSPSVFLDTETDDCTPMIIGETHILEFMQSDKFKPIFDTSIVIPFGTGIGSYTTNEIVMPVLFGSLEKHQSVLLGTRYCAPVNRKQYLDLVLNSHVIVHLEKDGWNLFTANTGLTVGNCLFIVHVTSDDLSNLGSVQLNFLPMIGAKSVILVENNGKYYYYRGIRYPGIPKVPFGEEIQPKFDEYIASPIYFPIIENKNDTQIYSPSHQASLSIKILNDVIATVSNDDDLIDMLTQVTIMGDSKTVTDVSTYLLGQIEKQIADDLASMIDSTYDAVALFSAGDFETIKKNAEFVQNAKKICNKKYEKLLEFINLEMVSVRGCVSKNHSLERVKRKNDIKKNVSDVLHMKTEEIVAEQAAACDEHGFIVCNFSTAHMLQILTDLNNSVKAVTDGAYYEITDFIKGSYDKMHSFTLNDRCAILDGTTYAAICDIVRDKTRPFSGSGLELTLPTIGSQDGMSYADGVLPLPLYSSLVKVTDPYIAWNELANNSDIAHYRIALRNMLVKATCSRDFSVPADSKGLGAMMGLVLLDLLEQITQPLSSTSALDEGDSMLTMIRGLLGFILTLMASGVSGQLTAWELFKPENKGFSVPDSVELYDVYLRLMKVARFARWNLGMANRRLMYISRKFLSTHTVM
jgi:hypothetical protein